MEIFCLGRLVSAEGHIMEPQKFRLNDIEDPKETKQNFRTLVITWFGRILHEVNSQFNQLVKSLLLYLKDKNLESGSKQLGIKTRTPLHHG